jgi:hypothetical protein
VLRCKTLGNILRAPFDSFQLPPPGGAVPDLEMVVDADDDHLPAQLRVLEQMRGHRHAALFVGDVLGRPGEEVPLQAPRALAERIQRGESRLDESSPIRTTVGEDALLEAARENDPVAECLAELCGESETILLIYEVLERADEQLGLVH